MKFLGIAIVAAAIGAPATAEPLTSLWTLEPVATPASTVVWGQAIVEQRLLPFKLAKLDAPGAGLDAKTYLFLVYNAAGQVAYCTFKDSSGNHVAKSLFIPALDKRPCLVDSDGDGRFDQKFSVFEKYGSLATPSGNLSEAKLLPASIPYTLADPHDAPVSMKLEMNLAGQKSPEGFQVGVKLDKRGTGEWESLVGNPPRTGNTLTILNAAITVTAVAGDKATTSVDIRSGVYLKGSSSGVIVPTELPNFLR